MEELQFISESPVQYKIEMPDDNSKFWITSESEIVSLLNSIYELHEKFILFTKGGFVVSCILEIKSDGKHNYIKIDKGVNDSINKEIIKTGEVIVKSMLSGIEIIFELDDVEESSWNGFSCLIAKLPKRIHRLQRREAFRLRVPDYYKLAIEIPILDVKTNGFLNQKFKVLDMSLGGLCVADHDDIIYVEENTGANLFKNCLCVLPIDEKYGQYEKIKFDMEVRNIRSNSSNSQTSRRFGCKFVGLSRTHEMSINKFILKLQHELKQKL